MFKQSPCKFRFLFLILTIIAGYLILFTHSHYHGLMSVGDHGRDFYAFWRTGLFGDQPYKDYWWVYSPIMPYIYGFFFKFIGPQISTAIFVHHLFQLGAGIFIFLIIQTIATPIIALIAACWFWQFFPNFFFTFNHIGGIFFMMGVLYFILRYTQSKQTQHIYIALALGLLTTLVKLNFGIITLLITAISHASFKWSRKKQFERSDYIAWFIALIVMPIVTIIIHWFMSKGLSMTELRQCFPYLASDHPYNSTPIRTITMFWTIFTEQLTHGWQHIAFAILVWGCAIQTIIFCALKKIDKNQSSFLFWIIGILLLWAGLNFHEYLASGVFYRSHWSRPFMYIAFFTLIGSALKFWPAALRWITYGVLAFIILIGSKNFHQFVKPYYDANHRVAASNANAVVTNPTAWLTTVNTTTAYLNSILKEDETFFAMPYDVLYYYLTQRKSPTRQTIFFDHINISNEQELSIIQDLEEKKVPYILISSRQSSPETGLGTFGKTYCPLLYNYIANNFDVLKQFGDWQNTPGWAHNHGTVILKRK